MSYQTFPMPYNGPTPTTPYTNGNGNNGAVQAMFNQDMIGLEQIMDSIDHRIAERKKLKYDIIENLEQQRRRLEDTLNTFVFTDYNNSNPKMAATKTKLETELIKIDQKKGEEAVAAFRDVERLESEKRKIQEEIRGENAMKYLS